MFFTCVQAGKVYFWIRRYGIMKKIGAALVTVMLVAGASLAAPFNPAPRKIDNGGDSLTVVVVGDERFFYVTTESGDLLVQGKDNLYYYADQDGLPTKVKARDADARGSVARDAGGSALEGSRPGASRARQFRPAVNREKQMEAYRRLHPARVMPQDTAKAERAPWVPTRARNSSDAGKRALLKMVSPNGFVNGENRFPVAFVEFGSETNLDSTSMYNRFNREGDTKGGYVGSVRDYFHDQSMGVFTPGFDLYFVKVNANLADYIKKEAFFVKLTIDAIKQKYPSFDARRYDADNDGEVDMLGVIHAGPTFYSNNVSFGGFHYQLKYRNNGDVGVQDAGYGKKFNRYLVISQKSDLFPSFLHEFSHSMGLKDHYCVHGCHNSSDYTDSLYQSPGVYYWDVMATGMYANNSVSPPGYSAFERNFMGWMDYVELDPSVDITAIPPLNTSNVAYKVPVPSTEDEWFVLENRQLTGWDAKLPNHGLLVWHIDYDYDSWFNNTLNDNPAHQRVDVVEAGTIKVPDYSGGFRAKNFVDDPFPGSQNVTKLERFPAWKNSVSFGLFSITEKDTVVCFATRSGVRVDNCAYGAESSSSSANSSSSVTPQNVTLSEVEGSSSSALVESSSATTVASPVPGAGLFRLRVEGSRLHVDALVAGEKLLQVFDLQGNLLFQDRLAGESVEYDLAHFGHGARVVRVSGAGVSAVRAIRLK